MDRREGVEGIIGRLTLLFLLVICPIAVIYLTFFADRPREYDYGEARQIMEEKVIYDHRFTVYCDTPFGEDKTALTPAGFAARNGQPLRVNWEHAVPASALGANIEEYRHPPEECRSSQRKMNRRQCAERTNETYRLMLGDMYNLFPALEAVNFARSNREYADLPDAREQFGTCGAKWSRGKFEPPNRAKGQVARATLYMDDRYEEFSLSPGQRRLMQEWAAAFPVDKWECLRTRRIEKIQGNENQFVKKPCQKAGLW